MRTNTRVIVVSCAILGAAMGAGAQAPAPAPAPATLAERIGHTDPSRYRRSRSHGSEGDMACMTLVPRNAIPLLNFVHRCQMTAPRGGVGHHFHNRTEEMFVIFDGEAEFVKAGSLVIDLTGSLIIAAPAGMTGGGLRPYAAVGAGIIHAQSQEFLNLFQVRRTVPAGIVGGGVYGLLTNNVGVRFDYRYLRSLTTDDEFTIGANRRISYSRFVVGLLLRL